MGIVIPLFEVELLQHLILAHVMQSLAFCSVIVTPLFDLFRLTGSKNFAPQEDNTHESQDQQRQHQSCLEHGHPDRHSPKLHEDESQTTKKQESPEHGISFLKN